MPDELNEKFRKDQRIWEDCAHNYEEYILEVHPDIKAYQKYEEQLIDQILHHLISTYKRKVVLYDIGCGSARLHHRYGLKIAEERAMSAEDAKLVNKQRAPNEEFRYDKLLADNLVSVGGIDFSSEMLKIAKNKLKIAGLKSQIGKSLLLECGSAFDLTPMNKEPLPVVVSLCNSIGVMQGPLGAIELFKSMRRLVETAGGVALISAYQQAAIENFALNFYESTIPVSGQPRWLIPITYRIHGYKILPNKCKRAFDRDPTLSVDIYEQNGKLVEKGFKLIRDKTRVKQTIETGHIRTFADYESYWYSFELMNEWIKTHWAHNRTVHIDGKKYNNPAIQPTQFAILDSGNLLEGFIKNL